MDMSALRMKISDWISKYKYVLLIAMAGIVLMLIPAGKEAVQEEQAVASGISQRSVQEVLTQILANIKGAGKVQVMLTERAGQSTLYQMDQTSENRQDTVIITDADRAQNGLVQQVVPPTYRGAIILCQGADSASVRLSIMDAVSKVTGLDASEISVLKMK